MPEQISKLREEVSHPPENSEDKKEEVKHNWTTTERQSCVQDYGCEIIVDNGSQDEVSTKNAPTDACIVKYTVKDKLCFDLTRGSQYKLFDMYYDKFKGGIKSIGFGYGIVKPSMWGYQSPQQKKKKRKL
tara:strand:- start:655 stop:1044 length:390 start_codon:yes stop_codon:yes gene_type:complete